MSRCNKIFKECVAGYPKSCRDRVTLLSGRVMVLISVNLQGNICGRKEKPCGNCKSPNQINTIIEENLISIQNRLGIPIDTPCACKEYQKEPHKVYAWTPPGLPSDKVDEYFAQLPNNKVPRWQSPGELYREKQLMLQLPKQDLALAYCRHLDPMHYKPFEDFVNMRNELVLDIAYVREYLDRQNDCAKCRGTMLQGDVAVKSPKFGESVSWHPACFVCSTCDELLVDLTHCVKDRKLYCERHFAEQIKPRCSACDEVSWSHNKQIPVLKNNELNN